MILPMEFDPFLGEEVYPKDQLGPSCGFDSVFLQAPNHQFWDPMILRVQKVWHVAVFRWAIHFHPKVKTKKSRMLQQAVS